MRETTGRALKAAMARKAPLPSPRDRRAIRAAAGLSADDLARVLGVTATTVLRWERGERYPRGRLHEEYLATLTMLRSDQEAGGDAPAASH